MKLRQLTLPEAEYIAHRLAKEFMSTINEPIPPFHTREPGRLESCLNEPFQTFSGKPLYRTFSEKAAVLFYLVIKNHCFSNGNKRMAVTLTAVFYFINKRWITMSPVDLYELACYVAESDREERDQVHARLVKVFKDSTTLLPKTTQQ